MDKSTSERSVESAFDALPSFGSVEAAFHDDVEQPETPVFTGKQAAFVEPEIPHVSRRPGRRKRAGFYVKTNADGSINWAAMPEDQKAKAQQAGLSTQAAPLVQFSPEECKYIYGLLGELEATGAAAIAKCPRELARKFFRYSEEECAMLADPTSRVLSKHGGKLLGWKDEFLLIVALAQLHWRKMTDFTTELKAQKQAQQQQPIPPRPEAERAAKELLMS